MKTQSFIVLIMVGLVMSISTSCNNPDKNNKLKEKELELQKRELDLKQKELEIKEKDLSEKSKDLVKEKTIKPKPKTDSASIKKSKYTATGIIRSVDYPRNYSWEITIETSDSTNILIWINPIDFIVSKDSEKLDKLKVGTKIGVIGKWEDNSEKKEITVVKFDIL